MKFNFFKKNNEVDLQNAFNNDGLGKYDFDNKKKVDKVVIILIVLIALVTIVVVALLIRSTLIGRAHDKESKDILANFESQLPRNNEQATRTDTADVNPNVEINTPDIVNREQVQRGARIMYGEHEIVGSIRIPKTGVNYPILTPTTKETLEISTPLFSTDNGVNEPGNTTIFGHNYRNGKFFSNNHKLKTGDAVYIKDVSGREIKYVIYHTFYTSPSDGAYIRRETNGAREISLSTCSDNLTQRFVILAKEAADQQ